MDEDKNIKKVQVVGFVHTNTDDPWRTQRDYRNEQKRAKIIFLTQIISLLVAIISMVVTSYIAITNIREKQKVEVEVIHKYPPTQVEAQSATSSLPKQNKNKLNLNLNNDHR